MAVLDDFLSMNVAPMKTLLIYTHRHALLHTSSIRHNNEICEMGDGKASSSAGQWGRLCSLKIYSILRNLCSHSKFMFNFKPSLK